MSKKINKQFFEIKTVFLADFFNLKFTKNMMAHKEVLFLF